MRRLITTWVMAAALLPTAAPGAMKLSNLRARHVAGQTYLTWDEAGLGPKVRLAVYRSAEPISADNVARATLLNRDLMLGTSCDFADLRAAKYRRFTPLPVEGIRGAVVPWDGGKDPVSGAPAPHRLAPRNGLYVHTPARAGKAYYAVCVCDDDGRLLSAVEPGTSATTEPVAEKPAAGLNPILLVETIKTPIDAFRNRTLYVSISAIGTFQYDKKALADFKRWKTSGRHYVAYGTREHGWREGLPLNFTVFGGGRGVKLQPDDSNFAFMGFDNAWWFGVNDRITRPSELAEGVVRLSHQQRLLALIEWTVKRFHVDRERITGGGSSMGGTGTLELIVRHPGLFGWVVMGVPAVNLPALPNARRLSAIIWGPMDKPVRCAEGGTVWQALNSHTYLQTHQVALPMMFINHGRKDTWMRWKHNPGFYRLLQRQGQPFVAYWDNGPHSTGARTKRVLPALRKIVRPARSEAFLSFANGSANDEPGNGDVTDGDLVGAINLYYVSAEARETARRFRAEYGHDRDGATDGGTTDLIPQRLKAFPHKPGTVAAYRILDRGRQVKRGTVTADRHGRYRIRSAPADRRYTLELTPAGR